MEEEKKISALLEPPLKEKGYDLVKAALSRSKDGLKLEIVVDRLEPIGLEEIVEVSSFVSDVLDKNDPIEGAYTLDVSSAGAEKPIKLQNLASYVGKYVHLHLSRPFEGENILEGTLEELGEEAKLAYFVKGRKKVACFKKEDIDEARLAIKF
jgi:ribosome maturation factor RimP